MDASALAKRYTLELGADRVDHLFSHVSHDRFRCLMLGAAEVVSVLVRRRNAGSISQAGFSQALKSFTAEVINDDDFSTVPAENDTIVASLPLIDVHAINANDALVLKVFMDQATTLRPAGNDLVLVVADQRLLKAAQSEGLVTFDPENHSLADLDALIKA